MKNFITFNNFQKLALLLIMILKVTKNARSNKQDYLFFWWKRINCKLTLIKNIKTKLKRLKINNYNQKDKECRNKNIFVQKNKKLSECNSKWKNKFKKMRKN